MSNLINVLSIIMICFGIFMMLIGSIGIVRLPDFFCRIHATTKIDTVGILFCLGGFSIHEGITLTSLKLLTAIVFIGLSYPVGSHVLMNVAARNRFGSELITSQKSQKKDVL